MPALRTRDTISRSLEVTTDAPQPPSLSIISPTPRAFTFPVSHNLSDSPFSSPSSSPFEPERNTLPLLSTSTSSSTTPPPPHHFIRTLSPVSSLRSSSPSPSTHKRRKSSCSSDIVERRPRKGDEDYIKRPENAFILFRRKCCEDRQQAQEDAAASASVDGPTKKQRQADLSKTISQQWKSLSAEERQYWENLAKEKKKEHEQMYPNYVYRPQRAKDKLRAPAGMGSKKNKHEELLTSDGSVNVHGGSSVSFVLPMVAPRNHGRSASAPTPPPYQYIQIPNVYQMTPSCPTSPSLLPMISRRAAHPGHPEDALSNFDFLPPPNDAWMQSFGQAGQFEASIQSSEFLRGMFAMPVHAPDSITITQHDTMSMQQQQPPSSSILSPASAISLISPASNFTDSSPASSSPASSYMWEESSWCGSGDAMIGGDDFDLGAIPPIEIGIQHDGGDSLGKFMGGLGLGMDNSCINNAVEQQGKYTHFPMAMLDDAKFPEDALEFGQDFVQALGGESDGYLAFDGMLNGGHARY